MACVRAAIPRKKGVEKDKTEKKVKECWLDFKDGGSLVGGIFVIMTKPNNQIICQLPTPNLTPYN